MSRPLVTILGLLLVLTATIAPAAAQSAAPSAPAPAVSGTLREPSQNAAWGTFEGFTTSSNSFGFFLRFHPTNGHIMTVTPFEMEPDGQLACWYIEYNLVGAVDPNKTEGWQWQEVAGGRVLLNPAGATSTSIDGSMAQTYQMVGFTRQSDDNPRFSPIRLTVP